MKKILFFILISMFTLVNAQNLKQRQITEQSFFVEKNLNDFLPLKISDSLKLKIIAFGSNKKIFEKSARRYTKIQNFDTRKTNTLILLLFNDNYDIENYVDSITQTKTIVFLFNTKADFLPEVIKNNARTIIHTRLTDSLTQDYAAQLLFGAFSAYGNGIIKGGINFKYTIPQEVGLDSNFLYSKIDSIVNKGIEMKAFPGCQIFIAIDKKVIFDKSYGYHTYDKIIPVRNDHIYDLASITKIAATAPCLMLLNQEGYFSLNDRISDYYPLWKRTNKKDITFIDALTHQARLTPWIPFWKKLLLKNDKFKKNALSTKKSRRFAVKIADNLYMNKKYEKKIFKIIAQSPLLKNKQYKYSDLSFYIFPKIIEKMTGESFEKCIYENFYAPLGAFKIMFNPWKKYELKKIAPTEKDKYFRRQMICGYVHDEGAAMLGGVSGHAGLFSNAEDLGKLMQMYCDYGKFAGKRFLNENTLKIWTSYQFVSLQNRRAIAFDKPLLKHKEKGTPSPLASVYSFGHSGFTGTFAWADPQYKMIFVFLSNRVYPSRSYLNLLKYNIRPSIHTAIYTALLKKRLEANSQ